MGFAGGVSTFQFPSNESEVPSPAEPQGCVIRVLPVLVPIRTWGITGSGFDWDMEYRDGGDDGVDGVESDMGMDMMDARRRYVHACSDDNAYAACVMFHA